MNIKRSVYTKPKVEYFLIPTLEWKEHFYYITFGEILNPRSLHHWMKPLSFASLAVWVETFVGTSSWDSIARLVGAAILLREVTHADLPGGYSEHYEGW